MSKAATTAIGLYNKAVKAFNAVAVRHQALKNQAGKNARSGREDQGGTYNILFPQPAVPDKFSTEIGYNIDAGGKLYENSEERVKIIQKNLQSADLDVVCLQEVVEDVFKKLRDANPAYECVWAPHTKRSGMHGVAIF